MASFPTDDVLGVDKPRDKSAPVDCVVIRCLTCDLPLVPNHHPDAGKPQFINVVGCQKGCLPCAEKRANGRREVITSTRIWLEDEIRVLDERDMWTPQERERHHVLREVLGKLNASEDERRSKYVGT